MRERDEPKAFPRSPGLKGRLLLTLVHGEAGHASPRRIAGIARLFCSKELGADDRMQSIGPDQETSLHFFSRSKAHAYSLLVLLKANSLHMRAETSLLKSLHESRLEFGSMDRNRTCPTALHGLLHRQVHQHIPSPGAKMTKAQRSGNGLQHVGESELLQSLDGIARQNHACSHFAILLGAFKHESFDPVPLESKRCGKASNAPPNNDDRHGRGRGRLREFHTDLLVSSPQPCSAILSKYSIASCAVSGFNILLSAKSCASGYPLLRTNSAAPCRS